MFPDIQRGARDSSRFQGFPERRVVHDFSARGVDEKGASPHPPEEGFICKMTSGIRPCPVQRHMQRDDIGLFQNGAERNKRAASFSAFARRIVPQHVHSEEFRRFDDFRSDIADADHAKRHAVQAPACPEGMPQQKRRHILHDGT